ncbi:MAG: hypothetical protein P8Y36_11360 [Alphaproteobacteria bacterium]
MLLQPAAAQQDDAKDDEEFKADYVLDFRPYRKELSKEPASTSTPASTSEFKSLVGKVFEGGFPVKGWKDRGGGLLHEPVWYHRYKHEDGRHLVIIDWVLPRREGTQQATFLVTDMLVVPPLQKNQTLAFECVEASKNITRKIIALVRTSQQNNNKWWRDIEQAWSVSLDNGRAKPFSTKGVRCENVGWGL